MCALNQGTRTSFSKKKYFDQTWHKSFLRDGILKGNTVVQGEIIAKEYKYTEFF
jgi:hypothetical protein